MPGSNAAPRGNVHFGRSQKTTHVISKLNRVIMEVMETGKWTGESKDVNGVPVV